MNKYALVMGAGVGGIRKGIRSGGSTRHSSLGTDKYWDEAYSKINGNGYGSPGVHRNG